MRHCQGIVNSCMGPYVIGKDSNSFWGKPWWSSVVGILGVCFTQWDFRYASIVVTCSSWRRWGGVGTLEIKRGI